MSSRMTSKPSLKFQQIVECPYCSRRMAMSLFEKDHVNGKCLGFVRDWKISPIAKQFKIRSSFNPQPLHNPKLPYQPQKSSFESICKALSDSSKTGKEALIALHATPGVGKSALLDQFANAVTQWKTSIAPPNLIENAPQWLCDAIIITVSYNHKSIFDIKEKPLSAQKSLIARIFWSYFIDQERDFPSFLSQIIQFLPETIQEAFTLIRSHHSTVRHGVEKAHILLIIDEFHKFRGLTSFQLTSAQKQKGIHLLNHVCSLMSDHANHIIISALDEDLLKNAATQSGRPIIWIPLTGLNFAQSCLTLEEAPGAPYLHHQCARASGGHPRSLEACLLSLQDYSGKFENQLLLHILEAASEKIIGGTRITTTMIAAGILGDSMPLNTTIDGFSGNALIADTIYIHNIVNKDRGLFVPLVPGLLLLSYLRSPENSYFQNILRHVLNLRIQDRSHISTHHGDRFELFHFYFEILKQVARNECKSLRYKQRWSVKKNFISSTIAGHYGLFQSRVYHPENQWLAAMRMQSFQQQISLRSFLNFKLLWPIHRFEDTTEEVLKHVEDLDNYIKTTPNFIKCDHNFQGIDCIFICRIEGTAQLAFLLLEMKYSGSSPSMHSKNIILEKLSFQKKTISKIRSHSKTYKVISVFVLWRELEPDLSGWFPWPRRYHSNANYRLRSHTSRNSFPTNLPDGIIVLGKQQLKQFYSSLNPFADFDSDVDNAHDLKELLYVKQPILCF